jgi:hypothetical protein
MKYARTKSPILMTDSHHVSVLDIKKRSHRSSSTLEQEKNLVALCSLLTLGVSSVGLLISLLALSAANTIASKPMPTLVQTINGKTIEIKALEGKQRSPKVIQDFTVNTLTKLFTWRVHLLPLSPEEILKPKVDLGMPIEAQGRTDLKIPSPVWMASFAISDDFRKEFLGEILAPLTTSLKILQGSSEVAFMPIAIQEPIEVKSNHPNEKLWKVKIVANLAVRTAANIPETLVPFNKDVYLRAVIPPIAPDSTQVDVKSDLQAVTAMARSSGLEIYGMEDFKQQELTK